MTARLTVSTALAMLALSGCTPPDEMSDELVTKEAPASTASAAATATAGGARDVDVDKDLYSFRYRYPAAVGAVPELAQMFDARARKSEADLAARAAEAREEARENGFPYNAYSENVAWKIAGDTPDWISLVADVSSYSGGAHGIYGIEPLLWDKQAKRTVQPIGIFTSSAALYDAAQERFCAKLDAERAKRRGPTEKESEAADNPTVSEFDACPPMSDLEIELKARGRHFDRVVFYAGPYVAGPYAEGAYEIAVPVDDAIRAVVKPEFRAGFGG